MDTESATDGSDTKNGEYNGWIGNYKMSSITDELETIKWPVHGLIRSVTVVDREY
jgi:hypothetical protein